MPDVKQTQPVQSDAESAALHDKDKYKDSQDLKDDVSRKEDMKNQPEKGSVQKEVRNEAKEAKVEDSNNNNSKNNDQLKKRGKDGAGEAAKEGVSSQLKGESARAQAKFMLEQQASKMVYGAAKSNTLLQAADKVVTTAVNGFHSVTSTITGLGQAAMNGLSWLGTTVMNFAGAIGHGVAAVGGWMVGGVSSFFGISATAATVTTATSAASVLAAGALAVTALVTNADIAQRDVNVNNCAADIVAVQSEMAEGEYDVIKLDYAQKIYSVLKTYGLADENIAGVIGNFEQESWIDPTGVETIFSERYTIGPRKQRAMDVGFDIRQIDSDYASRFPLIKLAGLGLGGFTDTNDGAVNNTRLRAFADANNMNWYDLELQLAFILAPHENGGFGNTLFETWEPEDNPRDAAFTFAKYWEGNTTLGQEERKSYAEKWFAMFSSWTVDTAYANSILDMAKANSLNAGESSLKNKYKDCGNAYWADNSSIAKAAVSYAYATEEEGSGNNGTELYQRVHDAVIPGDPYYQSCDRSVACAVRWAGADDNFEYGGCSSMVRHMSTSDKWEEIHWNGDSSKLLPGDVLIVSNASEGHVILYVGNEAIKEKYPDAPDNYEIVSGSISDPPSPLGGPGSRSPGCGVLWSSYSHYRAFRNVKPEADSKFKNAGIANAGNDGNVSDHGNTR